MTLTNLQKIPCTIGPHIERVWNMLGKEQFLPVDSSAVYEIINRLGVKRSQLPCICFFTNLKSKNLVVLPFSSLLDKAIDEVSQQDFLNLFRDLFDKVHIVANYPEGERLAKVEQEIARLRMGKTISKIEKIMLPEAVESVIGAIIKLLIV